MNHFTKLSHEEIVARQQGRQTMPRLPLCAVLNDIRSLYNVGSIFRTADGAGIEKLWLCGITGYPPHPMISKTALGAEDYVGWEYVESCVDVISKLKQQGYCIVLLEQTKNSLLISNLNKVHVGDQPMCLVVGNEISGVSDQVLKLCDMAVEIEMRGSKNSLNVSVAFGVAVYKMAEIVTQNSMKCYSDI